MGFEFDAPDQDDMQQGASNYLEAPGIYHAMVTAVYEGTQPPKANGEAKVMDGFSCTLDILAGTVKGQDGKIANLRFWNPKLTSKDGGKFARKKQAAFLIATGVIAPDQLGKRVSVDLKNAAGQQVVLKLELGEKSDEGKQYLDLAFTDIWHIDDPRAAACPKDEKAVGLIPKEMRRSAEYFAAIAGEKKSSSGNANVGSGSGQQKRETATAGAGASSGGVNLDDL